MNRPESRPCPICFARPRGSAFPYRTRFNDTLFAYLGCSRCGTVYVDPIPDAQTFALMYAKSTYHDIHYEGGKSESYVASAKLLGRFAQPGFTVLDYGCGMGGFMRACLPCGQVPFGVEFDIEAAKFAAQNTGCEVVSVEAFSNTFEGRTFDVIHLGDVLEHLPDPASTLKYLLQCLKPGGILFVEGPLQANASPVFWAAKLYGKFKSIVRPNFIPGDPPQHLIHTNSKAQFEFFARIDSSLHSVHWEVSDNGWPYDTGGAVKRAVAASAVAMGGRECLGLTFGNYFKSIWVKSTILPEVGS